MYKRLSNKISSQLMKTGSSLSGLATGGALLQEARHLGQSWRDMPSPKPAPGRHRISCWLATKSWSRKATDVFRTHHTHNTPRPSSLATQTGALLCSVYLGKSTCRRKPAVYLELKEQCRLQSWRTSSNPAEAGCAAFTHLAKPQPSRGHWDFESVVPSTENAAVELRWVR